MRFVKRMHAAVLACGMVVAGMAGLRAAPPAAHEHDHGHAHPSEGPHHGALIELGKEDYHAEIVHDEKTDTVTIYILVTSKPLCQALDGHGATGRLSVEIGGKMYGGKVGGHTHAHRP